MVICVATSLTSILPASAQNSDQTDEYKTLLKKIMTLSGSSASSEAIMSQLMASMKNGPFQQGEAYWKDFASKWTRKIEDKVMEVYAPIYQQHMTLDELKKVVAFYESPAGRKLGETATAVATVPRPAVRTAPAAEDRRSHLAAGWLARRGIPARQPGRERFATRRRGVCRQLARFGPSIPALRPATALLKRKGCWFAPFSTSRGAVRHPFLGLRAATRPA